MRLLLRFLGFLLLLALVLVGLAFVLPNKAHVERSITIARPISQIHLLLSGFRRFNEWSPWFARDPAATYTFSGPDTGVGAKLAWSSARRDVGSGSQTITAITPGKSVDVALDFGDMGLSKARFELQTESNETRVTWSLDSDLPLNLDARFGWNLVGRYMGLFMDRMVGPDYETGLANLRELANSFPNVDIAGIDPSIVELPARKVILVSAGSVTDDAAAIRASSASWQQLKKFAADHRLLVTDAPLTFTHSNDGQQWTFDAALVAQWDVMPQDTAVRGDNLPAGKAVQLAASGALRDRAKTIQKLYAWMAVKGLHARDRLFEEYPDGISVASTSTRIFIPVK